MSNRKFLDDAEKEKILLLSQSIRASDRTFCNFIACEILLENRGVSQEEFNEIKRINDNIRKFEDFYIANQHDTKVGDVYWIAHAFVDEGVNFQIGLNAIENIENPILNVVSVILQRDLWLSQKDLISDRTEFVKKGSQKKFTFRLKIRPHLNEKIGIVEFLSHAFLFSVEGNFLSRNNVAKLAKASREFRKLFSELNCNKPTEPPKTAPPKVKLVKSKKIK